METLTINELIAWVESRSFYGALRFEPHVHAKLVVGDAAQKITNAQVDILTRIRKVNRCSAETAAVLYSTSFGAYQMMGFNLYSPPDFDIPIANFLCSQQWQDRAFGSFLVRNRLQDFTPGKLAQSHVSRLEFSTKYNGSIDYENALISALQHFNFQVTP